MHILITGGEGFIGRRLAKELLEKGGLAQGDIIKSTLVDRAFPMDMPQDARLECIEADLSDETVIGKVLGQQPDLSSTR